jgi:hypothetical protein
MAVPTQLSDLSVTISANSPQSTDSTGSPSTVDDFFRAHAGFIAQVNAAKAPLASPAFTGTPTGITAAHVGLGNVANESKATMFTSPTFTGTVTVPTPFTLGSVSVTATGTQINAAAVTYAPSSSEYTPTVAYTVNCNSTSPFVCKWIKVGNMVHIAGIINVVPTAGTTLTRLEFNGPFNAATGKVYNVYGCMTATSGADSVAGSFTNGSGTTTNLLQLVFKTINTSTHSCSFSGICDIS